MCSLEVMCGTNGNNSSIFSFNSTGYFQASVLPGKQFKIWSPNLPSNYNSFAIYYIKLY